MFRLILLTTLAMLAFAGNSLLCRLALKQTQIDPTTFTCVRLVSGALTLYLLGRLRRTPAVGVASWTSAVALFVYALAFSLAYVSLSAATGALLLFGAVQVSMIATGVRRGERLRQRQWLGLGCAALGLVYLLLPGLQAPPWHGAVLMLVAGVAWGVYSLRGRGAGDPVRVTTGNFLRAVPLALGASLLNAGHESLDAMGLAYALASGMLASGLGYVVWYSVLPRLLATTAGIVQLSVPAIAALGGVVLLNEPLGSRVLLASVAILGGILLVIYRPRP